MNLMTIGESAAEAGPTRASAAIDAAAMMNLRMFPPAHWGTRAPRAAPVFKPAAPIQRRGAERQCPFSRGYFFCLLHCKMIRHHQSRSVRSVWRGLCPRERVRSNRNWLTRGSPLQNALTSRTQRLIGLLGAAQMVKNQLARARKLLLVAHHDFQLAPRPIVAEANGAQAHAGADHLERAIRDQADPHIGLHHAADGIE